MHTAHRSPNGHTYQAAQPHVHLAHYTKAIAFIQHHGHFAAITKDGLLAMSDCGSPRDCPGEADGDVWYEEPTVFEVDIDGMVPSAMVRQWLGY